ncbi:hypothetical protein K2X89_14770, partial [Myxococcota bacterium]|nr:hypothetical protein [Myxococcota bacterium]
MDGASRTGEARARGSRSSRTPKAPATVLLVGGGHAHVQVLRRFAMEPVPGARLVVVLDRPVAVYSGMVPGLVAG